MSSFMEFIWPTKKSNTQNTGRNTGRNVTRNTGRNTAINTARNTGRNTARNTGRNPGRNTGRNITSKQNQKNNSTKSLIEPRVRRGSMTNAELRAYRVQRNELDAQRRKEQEFYAAALQAQEEANRQKKWNMEVRRLIENKRKLQEQDQQIRNQMRILQQEQLRQKNGLAPLVRRTPTSQEMDWTSDPNIYKRNY